MWSPGVFGKRTHSGQKRGAIPFGKKSEVYLLQNKVQK